MNASHPFRAAERLPRTKTEDFRRIRAQLVSRPVRRSQSKVITPPARSASSSRMLSFEDREFMYPPLAEQSRQNQRAERRGQNGRLSRQDALFERQARVAEKANAKYRRPDNRDGAHERCDCRKGRANTGGRSTRTADRARQSQVRVSTAHWAERPGANKPWPRSRARKSPPQFRAVAERCARMRRARSRAARL